MSRRINANTILKAQHARKVRFQDSSLGGPRLINDLSKWYKSPKLSDITIVYGKKGEKTSEGHRFVLCNGSEWFTNASSHWMFISILYSIM